MQQNRTGIGNIAPDLARETFKNFLMGIGAVRRWRLQRPRAGAEFTGRDEELFNYAFASLQRLQKFVGSIKGKTIVEIGPGDFLTSGLAMLAAGAESYCVIDRFPGDYTSEAAKDWYQAIEDNWTKFSPEIEWAEGLSAANFPEGYAAKLELLSDPIETAEPQGKYDIVCSFQVGEHISDINAFAEIQNRVLTDQGVGLHRVDFGPHDCWQMYSDPLTFLQFTDAVWQATGSNRGTPNRFRHHEFMQAFEKANLHVEIVEIYYWDEKRIEFDKLNKRFQKMPRESLLVSSAVYRLKQK